MSQEIPCSNSALTQLLLHTDQKLESLRKHLSQKEQQNHQNEVELKNLQQYFEKQLHSIEIRLKESENYIQHKINEVQLQLKEQENNISHLLNEQQQNNLRLQHSYQNRIDDLTRRLKTIEGILL